MCFASTQNPYFRSELNYRAICDILFCDSDWCLDLWSFTGIILLLIKRLWNLTNSPWLFFYLILNLFFRLLAGYNKLFDKLKRFESNSFTAFCVKTLGFLTWMQQESWILEWPSTFTIYLLFIIFFETMWKEHSWF